MPELPEVETVRLGLTPHLAGRMLYGACVREPRLRWPVPAKLNELVDGQRIHRIDRRGKYLLVQMDQGSLIIHLGMSGSLRLTTTATKPEKHDHLDLLLANDGVLRYRDPRRFGALLWSAHPEQHPLIAHLGLEPLGESFSDASLHALCQGRKTAIKLLLMDAHLIVGVGNIYANESLFHAGIDPLLAAGNLTRPRCARLVDAVKNTLTKSILAGGSSLRDFVDGHGNPGYFQQTYFVYGRAGEPCRACGITVLQIRQSNRSTFYCPHCQRR
ncbi:MAG: DNA-formamidopyrimidine glycosylase [Hydrogenophilales bacterium 28-61-23]|nr:MAG: DNA-formamidopyrimidine glycosylase [Hydrogenophilales bacterium 28-61-23]